MFDLALPIALQHLMLASVAAADAMMHIFTSDPELVQFGIHYLRIAGWSYLMTGVSQCYLMIMKVTDHVRECAAISSGAVLLNIVFKYIMSLIQQKRTAVI